MNETDLAPVYIKPDFFDWGVFKSHGDLIWIVSTLGYLACIVIAFLLLRQVARRWNSAVAILLGLSTIGPMVVMGWASSTIQMTSAHYQETTHIPALKTFTLCFSVVVVVWLLSRWRSSRRA